MVFSLIKKKIRYKDPDLAPPERLAQPPVTEGTEEPLPGVDVVITPNHPEEDSLAENQVQTGGLPPKSNTKVRTKSQFMSLLRLKKRALIIAGIVVLLLSGGVAYAYVSDSVDFSDINFWGIGSEKAATESAGDSEVTATGDADSSDPDQPVTNKSDKTDSETPSGSSQPSSSGSAGGSTGSTESGTGSQPTTVTYTNKCYSPSSVTINKGATVKFVNDSGRDMWPASDNHPSHDEYPVKDANKESTFDPKDSIAEGGSWSFVFNVTGTWYYHDHNHPSCHGTIIVK